MKTKLQFLIITILASAGIVSAQVTGVGVVRPATPAFVGWDGTGANPGSLEIRNDFNHPINFFTNTTQRATITGAGLVGIGTSTPSSLLTVTGGDIDLGTSTTSYMIGGNAVLRNNGISSNIFVGVGAGVSVTTSVGNTFVGCDAGASQTTSTGGENTFIGCLAGKSSTTSAVNAYLGTGAGQFNATGVGNVFTGYFAGRYNKADYNAFHGFQSGYGDAFSMATYGSFNSFLGANSGFTNVEGEKNVFVGTNAGYSNTEGSLNTFVGFDAQATGVHAASLNNAGAIGANATVTEENTLILGSIAGVNGASAHTSVGIGLTETDAKFDVRNIDRFVAGNFLTEMATPLDNAGVVATVLGAENINLAGFFDAEGTDGQNIGVLGRTNNSTEANVGGIFTAPFQSSPTDIGIIAAGRTSALFFGDGTVFGNWTWTSDIALKDSIQNITGALSTLSQLQPKDYVFKTSAYPYLNLPSGRQYGFVAQQLDTIATTSRLVNDIYHPEIADSHGTTIMEEIDFKGINYTGLIPLVVAGVNELNTNKVGTSTTAADSNYVTKWSTAGKTLVNSAIYNQGTRVGINTTSPGGVLHVNSASVSNLIQTDIATTDTNIIRMLKSGTEYAKLWVNANSNHFIIQASRASGGLIFNSGGATTNMVISNGGAIGIRTTAPASVLHVDGSLGIASGEVFRTNGPASSATYWKLLRGGSEYGRIYNNNDNHFYVQANNGSGDLRFNSGGTNTRMTVASGGNVGINTTSPGNKLEINHGTANNSGLRFTQLTSASTTQAANGKALSVNSNGDVILTDHAVAACTTGTTNYITKWTGTDLICNSLIYDSGTKIGIATAAPAAKLDVDGGDQSIGLRAEGDSIGSASYGEFAGAYGQATGNLSFQAGVIGQSINSEEQNVGVLGYAYFEANEAENHGVSGIAGGSDNENFGVKGEAEYESETAKNVGVSGQASGSSDENIAGYFIADGVTGLNEGIYARADSPGYAGFFDGDLAYTGTLYNFSDRQLKQNVHDLNDPLALLSKLQPKNYEFRTAEFPYMNLPGGKQYGLIAQEVEQVMPELVRDITKPEYRNGDGEVLQQQVTYKGLNYEALIPVLVAGINKQQAIIDSLSSELSTRMSEMESKMSNCCGAGSNYEAPKGETVNRLDVELNALQVVILEQNVPNPFAEQTSISYFIPEDAGRAQMQFTDFSGRVIKTVDLEKGSGIVTVFAQTLGSGTYAYSLIIDGKVVETKRMIKTK